MNIRLLNSKDTLKLTEYLAPYKAECMFICSNLRAAGIEYADADFQGEYWGYFDNFTKQLEGIIVHYWNGNVMMHVIEQIVLKQLTNHLKNNLMRAIAGVLGPNVQAEYVIDALGLSRASYNINCNEKLYEIDLKNIIEPDIPQNLHIISVRDIAKDTLIKWIQAYDIEALGALNDNNLEARAIQDAERLIKKNDCWILLLNQTPVSMSAFNARLEDMVQVGPVWTPPEYRNRGFARLLLTYNLAREKERGTKKAILFTDNPAAMKLYQNIGFKNIGDYRLALLRDPANLQEEV